MSGWTDDQCRELTFHCLHRLQWLVGSNSIEGIYFRNSWQTGIGVDPTWEQLQNELDATGPMGIHVSSDVVILSVLASHQANPTGQVWMQSVRLR